MAQSALIHQLLNLGEWRAFEDARGHHNLLCLLEPGHNPDLAATLTTARGQGKLSQSILQAIVTGQSPHIQAQVKQHELYHAPGYQIYLTGIRSQQRSLDQLLAYLQQDAQELKTLAQIHQGIVTGADRLTARQQALGLPGHLGTGVFVLHESEIPTTWSADFQQQWLKPWFKNSDIQRWRPSEHSPYQVLYIPRQTTELPPELLAHLKPFRPWLERRREVQLGLIPWWQLHWPRRQPLFEQPKIVVPQRHRLNCFAYTEQPWYASADVYFLSAAPEVLKYLLVLLNSRMMYHWLYHRGKRKGEMLELYQQPLSSIPVRIPTPQDLPKWNSWANACLRTKSPQKKLTTQLEQHLWDLYELPSAIRDWLKLH